MLESYPTTDSVFSMKKSPPTLQGSYQYDALDRLTTRNATHRFYQNDRIATEVEGANTRRFMEFDAQPLAVQEGQTTSLLATDLQTSVLQHASAAGTQAYAYTPYGHHPAENGITRLLAFNGEHPEAVTGHYLLGQGYRAYNPVLMRFNSPDSWSPFGEGEINAYAYPTNPLMMQDPTGHVWQWAKGILRVFKIIRTTKQTNQGIKALYRNTMTSFKKIDEDFIPDMNPVTKIPLPNKVLVKQATNHLNIANPKIVEFQRLKTLKTQAELPSRNRVWINPTPPRRAINKTPSLFDDAVIRNQNNQTQQLNSQIWGMRNQALKHLKASKKMLETVISNRAIRFER